MKKKDLKKLELITYNENIPLLDELYVVISNKKHDSGYKKYKIYGIADSDGKTTYAKCLSEWSDVIHIVPTFLIEWSNYYSSVLSIDSVETNLFRIIVRNGKIKVKYNLSDFLFEIVK